MVRIAGVVGVVTHSHAPSRRCMCLLKACMMSLQCMLSIFYGASQNAQVLVMFFAILYESLACGVPFSFFLSVVLKVLPVVMQRFK
jgi:hypothetical protein